MAVDVCSTSEASISPRLSFSRDLQDPSSDDINSIYSDSIDPIRSDQFLLSPTFDFGFCTSSNLTPADELFSNGKILPTQIKTPEPKPASKDPKSDTQKKPLKEFVFQNDEDRDRDRDRDRDPDHEQEKPASRSFWQFRRSASLNLDNCKAPKGLLRSLSIKSLSRSNSTGSALNPNRNSGAKGMEKPKDPVWLRRCASLNQPPPSSTHVYYAYQNSNNAKNCRGVRNRIIPILNIPPAYNISKGTINFFGFGSLFCNGKIKKKTKS